MERAVLERRSGLGVLVEDQNRLDTYFDDINEAVTDRLTELFVQYVDQNPEAGITITKSDGFATAAYYASSTYEKEKEHLDEILEEIHRKNTDTFKNTEEVFTLFVRAMIRGDLLPLARAVENTYGKGSFRKLGKSTKA